jgi:hypothetical protein
MPRHRQAWVRQTAAASQLKLTTLDDRRDVRELSDEELTAIIWSGLSEEKSASAPDL